MNFHLKNNNYLVKNNASKNIIFYFIGVIFLIAIFSLPSVRNLLFGIGGPIWSVRNSINYFLSDNIKLLNSKINLIDENSLLKEQIKSYEKEQALFSLLKKENEDLKNILGRKISGRNVLLSAVLSKPYLSPYDTLVIDTGLFDGVSVDDKVLADGNTYIGYVSEVYDNFSKVVLYSSPGEKVKVLIGNSNIEKDATGLGGGNFEVQIPREIDIKEGDPIVIPSISANVFGVVEKIEFKESDSFQNIIFKNPINIGELKFIEVLLSNKKNV